MITIKATGDTTLYTAGKYCEEDILVKVPEGSGGESTPTQEKTINITKNGTTEITPDDGYALSKVTANVNVPIPDGYIKPSGTLLIDENGTHDVTDKASVSVNVPIPDGYIVPSGTTNITTNGTHDVTSYKDANINVQPKLQDKTITENGTYSADAEYDGFGQVTVEVASGGGVDDSMYTEAVTAQTELIDELTQILNTKANPPTTNMGTCTVIVEVPAKANHYICREHITDGAIVYNVSKNHTADDITLTSVRCDSILYIATSMKAATATDGEVVRVISGQGVVYKTPSLNNSIAILTLTN